MTFNEAIVVMREGKRVRRRKWGDQRQGVGVRNHPRPEFIVFRIREEIWLPYSADDVLADDWEETDEPKVRT